MFCYIPKMIWGVFFRIACFISFGYTWPNKPFDINQNIYSVKYQSTFYFTSNKCCTKAFAISLKQHYYILLEYSYEFHIKLGRKYVQMMTENQLKKGKCHKRMFFVYSLRIGHEKFHLSNTIENAILVHLKDDIVIINAKWMSFLHNMEAS